MLEEKFETKVVDGYEIRRYEHEIRIEEDKYEQGYLFKRERNAGKGDFVIVYIGLDKDAWDNIRWLNNNKEQ